MTDQNEKKIYIKTELLKKMSINYREDITRATSTILSLRIMQALK